MNSFYGGRRASAADRQTHTQPYETDRPPGKRTTHGSVSRKKDVTEYQKFKENFKSMMVV